MLAPDCMTYRTTTPVSGLVAIDGETYYRFPNGGGLVALTARVSPHAHVAKGARVKDHAVVASGARLFGESVAEDHALVGSMVTLRDQAHVGGRAVVCDGVVLREECYVGGASYLRGPIVVEGRGRVVDQVLQGRFVIH